MRVKVFLYIGFKGLNLQGTAKLFVSREIPGMNRSRINPSIAVARG